MSLNPFRWYKEHNIEQQAKKKAHQEYLERLRVERAAALRLEKKQRFRQRLILVTVLSLTVGFYFIYKNYIVEPEKEWITTDEGVKIYEIRASKNATYSWKGEILGGCANNKGVLNTQDGTAKSSKTITASWGGTIPEDWKKTKHGMFLGKVVGDYPKGFGVLKKGSKTYIGNFEKGSLEGYIKEYEGNTLLYRGGYFGNAYNGFGTLFKNGEFLSGNWKDGNLNDGYLNEKGKSISRIWNRYFGNEEDENRKWMNLSKEEFAQLDKDSFQQYLALLLNNYIESKVIEVTEKRTAFFSLQPVRMFWQTLFTSRGSRSDGWIKELGKKGLTKDDLEFFINSYVTDYNKKNVHGITLKNLKLSNFQENEIIDDAAFNSLHDMEFAGWSQNFWFDAAITYLVMFIITGAISFFALPFAVHLKIIDFVVMGIVAVIVLLLSFILEDIKPEFIQSISSNYITYLLNQQIFQKIL